MIDNGILTENDPVELLEGWIVSKMPHDPEHDSSIDKTAESLREILPKSWRIRVQSAITTGDSEPEPDITVARGPADRYDDKHPGPGDIAMLVESSNSSLADDRAEKGRVYARASIPVYWILNTKDRQVEVHTNPSGSTENPSYATRQIYRSTASVPVVIAGKQLGTILVASMIPPKRPARPRTNGRHRKGV